jgi:hypothetical protein
MSRNILPSGAAPKPSLLGRISFSVTIGVLSSVDRSGIVRQRGWIGEALKLMR